MLSLVLVLAPSTWMMLLVLQVLANYWSVLAGQSQVMTVFTLLMLVLDVKVIFSEIQNLQMLRQKFGNNIIMQFRAQLVSCDWLEVMFPMRGELKSV